MAQKINGRPLSDTIKLNIVEEVSKLKKIGVQPKLTVILCGGDSSAYSYAKSKEKTANLLGIEIDIIDLAGMIYQDKLLDVIKEKNEDGSNHGILLEFPLHESIDPDIAINSISPSKDIDGLSAYNLGLIAMGKEKDAILPATPQSCIELAMTFSDLSGKRVAVIGRGRTVGKPLINMLINRNATVTVCHTKTSDIKRTIKDCEVVFVAIGKPYAIDEGHLNTDQIVIDAGINFVDGKLAGDVSPNAYDKLAAFTPVPGGVGILTSTIIFRNLVNAIKIQRLIN